MSKIRDFFRSIGSAIANSSVGQWFKRKFSRSKPKPPYSSTPAENPGFIPDDIANIQETPISNQLPTGQSVQQQTPVIPILDLPPAPLHPTRQTRSQALAEIAAPIQAQLEKTYKPRTFKWRIRLTNNSSMDVIKSENKSAYEPIETFRDNADNLQEFTKSMEEKLQRLDDLSASNNLSIRLIVKGPANNGPYCIALFRNFLGENIPLDVLAWLGDAVCGRTPTDMQPYPSKNGDGTIYETILIKYGSDRFNMLRRIQGLLRDKVNLEPGSMWRQEANYMLKKYAECRHALLENTSSLDGKTYDARRQQFDRLMNNTGLYFFNKGSNDLHTILPELESLEPEFKGALDRAKTIFLNYSQKLQALLRYQDYGDSPLKPDVSPPAPTSEEENAVNQAMDNVRTAIQAFDPILRSYLANLGGEFLDFEHYEGDRTKLIDFSALMNRMEFRAASMLCKDQFVSKNYEIVT